MASPGLALLPFGHPYVKHVQWQQAMHAAGFIDRMLHCSGCMQLMQDIQQRPAETCTDKSAHRSQTLRIALAAQSMPCCP